LTLLLRAFWSAEPLAFPFDLKKLSAPVVLTDSRIVRVQEF